MKQIISTLLTVVILAAAVFIGYPYYKNATSSLSKATKAESSGQLQAAYDHYIDALCQLTTSTEIPDFNKSKVVESKIWKSDLVKYITFLTQPLPKSEDFTHVLSKVNNYNDRFAHSESKVINMKSRSIDTAAFAEEWAKTFYAPTAPFNPSADLDIAYDAYLKHASFLTLSADKGFTYDINLINLSSGTQTVFKVFSEGETTALIFPGQHLILCRSSVAFSEKQMWKSPISIATITISDTTSHLSGMLITKVQRPSK